MPVVGVPDGSVVEPAHAAVPPPIQAPPMRETPPQYLPRMPMPDDTLPPSERLRDPAAEPQPAASGAQSASGDAAPSSDQNPGEGGPEVNGPDMAMVANAFFKARWKDPLSEEELAAWRMFGVGKWQPPGRIAYLFIVIGSVGSRLLEHTPLGPIVTGFFERTSARFEAWLATVFGEEPRPAPQPAATRAAVATPAAEASASPRPVARPARSAAATATVDVPREINPQDDWDAVYGVAPEAA